MAENPHPPLSFDWYAFEAEEKEKELRVYLAMECKLNKTQVSKVFELLTAWFDFMSQADEEART